MLVLELKNEMTKVLRVLWNPKKDIYQYKTQDIKSEIQSTTKRSMLAQIASFDPLNLMGSIIMKAKILMQDNMWKLKINWEKPVPMKMHNECEKYLYKSISLRELCIPRFLCTYKG